jgi:hypothetical protein
MKFTDKSYRGHTGQGRKKARSMGDGLGLVVPCGPILRSCCRLEIGLLPKLWPGRGGGGGDSGIEHAFLIPL